MTPEIAHKIGRELTEKIAPGYEVVVATHTDRKHVHNHIVINSVSFETGLKYDSNLNQYYFSRDQSDKLCRDYGLSVIEHKKDKVIDQKTYRAAERGESWKVRMMKVIDEARNSSKSKDEFVSYMESMGYKVKWQNENVSFLDPDHMKYIRGKTLGANYTKGAIEYGFNGTQRNSQNAVRTDERGFDGTNAGDIYRNKKHDRSKQIDSSCDNRRIEKAHKGYTKYADGNSKKPNRVKNYSNEAQRVLGLRKVISGNDKNDDVLESEIFIANLVLKSIWKETFGKQTEDKKMGIQSFAIDRELARKSEIYKKELEILSTEYAKLRTKVLSEADKLNLQIRIENFEKLKTDIQTLKISGFGTKTIEEMKQCGNTYFMSVSKKDINILKQSGSAFACEASQLKGKFNIAILEKDKEKINSIIKKEYSKIQEKANIKKVSRSGR